MFFILRSMCFRLCACFLTLRTYFSLVIYGLMLRACFLMLLVCFSFALRARNTSHVSLCSMYIFPFALYAIHAPHVSSYTLCIFLFWHSVVHAPLMLFFLHFMRIFHFHAPCVFSNAPCIFSFYSLCASCFAHNFSLLAYFLFSLYALQAPWVLLSLCSLHLMLCACLNALCANTSLPWSVHVTLRSVCKLITCTRCTPIFAL